MTLSALFLLQHVRFHAISELIRAGLGLQQLSFYLHGDSLDFYEDIACAYPKLKSGGGLELLRSCEGNSKQLAIIPPPPAGYTVLYLKSIMGHAKVYIYTKL